MRNRPPVSGGQYESEQIWLEVKANLLQIRRNVVGILNLRAIRLLAILERPDYIAILEFSVLNVMERGDYRRALDNLRDFVLENPVLDQILPQLIDEVEPGLTELALCAHEFDLDG